MAISMSVKNLVRRDKTAGLVFSNTFFQLFGKFVSMSITMLTTVLVTRNYGVEGYGYFSLMQTIPALFFIIVDFGLNAVAMKDLEKDWEHANKYFKNMLVVRIIFSLILIVLTALLIGQFFDYPQDLKFGIYLSLLLILTHSLYATGNLFFQFKLKYDYSVIGYIAGSFLVLLLSVILIYLDVSIIWVNFTYVLGGFLTFLVSLRYLARMGVTYKKSIPLDFALWKMHFIAALPLGIMFIFSQVNFRADSIMLSKLRLPLGLGFNNIETVAIYGIAYKIFEVCLVLPTFFMNATYPIYIKKLTIGAEVFKVFFFKTLGILALGGAAITLIGYLLSPFIIQVVGGEQFSDSVILLRILFGGIGVFFISAPLSYFILTLGKQIYLPFAYLAAGVFNVTLNYFLIPRYSFFASAYLTWLSELVVLIALALFAVRAWRLYNRAHNVASQ